MGQRIEFFISGTPKPGGSKQGFVLRRGGQIVTRPNGAPVVIMKEASNNADWKANCAFFGRQAFEGIAPFNDVDLQLEVTFIMARPQGHYRTGKRAGELRDNAPIFKRSTPDTTKIMRSTEDALTGIAWTDDKIIVRQYAQKMYGDKTGAHVVISTIDTKPTNADEATVAAPLFELV